MVESWRVWILAWWWLFTPCPLVQKNVGTIPSCSSRLGLWFRPIDIHRFVEFFRTKEAKVRQEQFVLLLGNMSWRLHLDCINKFNLCWRNFCKRHGRISSAFAKNILVCINTCSCASRTDDLRTRQEMTCLRACVNKMLKNHPHGNVFKEIWHLARHVETFVLPITDPEQEEQTRARKILYPMR